MILQQKQMEIIDFYFRLGSEIGKISKEQRDDLLYYISELIGEATTIEYKNKMLTVLYHCCFAEDITLEEVWEIYWNLVSTIFSHSELNLLQGSIRTLYGYIVDSIISVIPNEYRYHLLSERNKNIIVITTSQFLGISHAPTIRVLDYAYTIQKELDKKVIIINDGGMNFIKNQSVRGKATFNFVQEYNSLQYVEYKDEKIEFFQNPLAMPNVDAIKSILDFVYEVNPLIVYNIGASSIISDCCSLFTTTVSLPCSFEIPISKSDYLLLGRKIEARDKNAVEEIRGNSEIIETVINYQYRTSNLTYNRKQFLCTDKDFLICVVGNRIEAELNQEFVTLINRITKELSNIKIALVGRMDNQHRVLEKFSHPNKIVLTGSLEDAGEFMRVCDMYLNPKRAGGGRSSFESLCVGTPVETLAYGDVGYTCGDEFTHTTYEDIFIDICRCYENREYLSQKVELAKKRAEELSDIKGTLHHVIKEVIRRELENGQ